MFEIFCHHHHHYQHHGHEDIQMTVTTQQFYYNLPLQGYMFRLLRVIIRPSNEPTQDYLIPSASPIVSATGSQSALGI